MKDSDNPKVINDISTITTTLNSPHILNSSLQDDKYVIKNNANLSSLSSFPTYPLTSILRSNISHLQKPSAKHFAPNTVTSKDETIFASTESHSVKHSADGFSTRNHTDNQSHRSHNEYLNYGRLQVNHSRISVKGEFPDKIDGKPAPHTLSRGRRTGLDAVLKQDTSTEMFFQSRNKKVRKKIPKNGQKYKNRWNGNGQSKFEGHWIEYDFDKGTMTTTEDSSLPINPEGLRNPKLLVGPWVEEPTISKSKAKFG